MRSHPVDAAPSASRRDAGPEEIALAGWLEDGGEYVNLPELFRPIKRRVPVKHAHRDAE